MSFLFNNVHLKKIDRMVNRWKTSSPKLFNKFFLKFPTGGVVWGSAMTLTVFHVFNLFAGKYFSMRSPATFYENHIYEFVNLIKMNNLIGTAVVYIYLSEIFKLIALIPFLNILSFVFNLISLPVGFLSGLFFGNHLAWVAWGGVILFGQTNIPFAFLFFILLYHLCSHVAGQETLHYIRLGKYTSLGLHGRHSLLLMFNAITSLVVIAIIKTDPVLTSQLKTILYYLVSVQIIFLLILAYFFRNKPKLIPEDNGIY